jgi:hypothetical protein
LEAGGERDGPERAVRGDVGAEDTGEGGGADGLSGCRRARQAGLGDGRTGPEDGPGCMAVGSR